MSGYLSSLLSRTFQLPDNAVQPMLTPLFGSPDSGPVLNHPEIVGAQETIAAIHRRNVESDGHQQNVSSEPARVPLAEISSVPHHDEVYPDLPDPTTSDAPFRVEGRKPAPANASSLVASLTPQASSQIVEHEEVVLSDPRGIDDQQLDSAISRQAPANSRPELLRIPDSRQRTDPESATQVRLVATHPRNLESAVPTHLSADLTEASSSKSLPGLLQAPSGKRLPRSQEEKVSKTYRQQAGHLTAGAELPRTTAAAEIQVGGKPAIQLTESSRTRLPESLFAIRSPRRVHPEPAPAVVPTIEVTIGRIEVRGSSSPEPQRQETQSSRTSSLDDYLRRRSGRSRE
jgi:hypothetical protein